MSIYHIIFVNLIFKHKIYTLVFLNRDISDNPIVCDCEISGFLDWVKRKVKLGPKSECHEPTTLKDISIKHLHLDMLNCVRPKSNIPPAVEIIPKSNLVSKKLLSDNMLNVFDIYFYFIKVLFEGDSIEILCRAVGTDALGGIILTWNTSALNNSASIIVTDGDFENTGLIQRLECYNFCMHNF